ncbi:MAG: hypothetical protein Q9217_000796 [Psora testacea]
MVAKTIDSLCKPSASPTSFDAVSTSSPHQGTNILTVGSTQNCLVTIDSDRVINLRKIELEHDRPNVLVASKELPAHESAVLGACSLTDWHQWGGSDFLTYSARGTLLLWNFDGMCSGRIDIAIAEPTDMPDVYPNELKVLVASDTEAMLYAGDKLGKLRKKQLIKRISVVNPLGHIAGQVQAHNGDVNGIATTKLDDRNLVATCGRDRTLQLFLQASGELTLLQTLGDHAAAVTDLIFLDSGSTLVSISSDRTMLMRKAAYGAHQSVAYLPVRAITLRASPVSFAAVPSEPSIMVVSTMDRQIHRYDLSSGRLVHAFKPLDPTSNDSVIGNSLQVTNFGHGEESLKVILAIASVDRSIRLYDYYTGSLLGYEYGQSAVSSVRLMQQDDSNMRAYNLISCGLDGTIIVFKVSIPPPPKYPGTPSESPIPTQWLKHTPSSSQPLRKTLTKSEVADFQKAFQDSYGDTIRSIRSPSPSRMRKKTSRYSMATPTRANATGIVATNYMSDTSSSQRKSSHDRSPASSNPKHTVKATKPRLRPSLDRRHRSKSTAALNELDASGEQICNSLRTFRKGIISVSNKLEPAIAKELQRELKLTIDTMNDIGGTKEIQDAEEALTGDLLDTYLAKMIDERLAMAQRNQATHVEENARPDAVSNAHVKAGAAAGQ